MKIHLDYFRHNSNAHTHWKMKGLMAKYKIEGYGKFWILAEIIGGEDNCKLDLSNPIKKLTISAECGFETIELFDDFLNYCCKELHLIKCQQGIITTKISQEDLQKMESTNKRKREWKKKHKSDVPKNKVARKKTSQLELATKGDVHSEKGDVLKSGIAYKQYTTPQNTTVQNTTEHLSNTLEREKVDKEKKGNLSPSKPDKNPYEKKYKAFQEWVKENANSLLALPEFITIDEYADLLKKFPSEEGKAYFQKKLKEMHNTKNLKSKYNNVYSTLIKWIEMDGDLHKNKFLKRT